MSKRLELCSWNFYRLFTLTISVIAIFQSHGWFKSYGNVKQGVGKGVELARGESVTTRGWFEVELPVSCIQLLMSVGYLP